MKLNIQMFAEGSQTFTGSFNGSSAAYAQFYAIRTYTQDDTVFPAKTTETITLYVKKLSSVIYSNNTAAPYSIKDGTTTLKSGTCSFNLGNIGVGSSQKLADYTRTLTHKDDGSLDNYTLNVTFTTQVSLGTGTISKTVTTPTVNAGYSVAGENVDIGNSYYGRKMNIKVGVRADTGYTFDLSYEFTKQDGSVTTGIIASNLTTTPYVWEMTTEQANAMLSELPTSEELPLKLTIKCTTYNNGVQVGVPTTNIVDATTITGPSVNGAETTVVETVANIAALTNSQYVVKDLSKMRFTIVATPPTGTTIVDYDIGVSGRTITSATNVVLIENITENINGITTFSTHPKDARGNASESWILELPFIDYIKSEYKNTECVVSRTDSDIDKVSVLLTANHFSGKIGTTTNSLTLGYKYREKGTSNYVVGTTPLTLDTEITLTETFDHNKNYEFVFTINDLIYTGSEMSKTVPSSQYVMFEHENGVDFKNATIMGEQIAVLSMISMGIEEFGADYIRFKKNETLGYGIQICWGSINVPSGSTAIGVFGADPGRNITGATFPKAFSEAPRTSALVARCSTSTYWGIGCQYQANTATKLGNICLQRRSSTNATIAGTIDWCAIGKWR